MMKSPWILMVGLALLGGGCSEVPDTRNEKEEELKPTFMFWCFRKEIVDSDYHVPRMTTPQTAELIRNRLKGIPGYVDSRVDLETNILTVSYAGSTVRKMNFEEAIAQAGFDVNFRPAHKPASKQEAR